MTLSTLHADGDSSSLSFDCGSLPVIDAIRDAGHEPNGYFWEGVAAIVAPAVVQQIELDPEAETFFAYGEEAPLQAFQAALEPVLDDPAAITALITKAEADGFEFDD